MDVLGVRMSEGPVPVDRGLPSPASAGRTRTRPPCRRPGCGGEPQEEAIVATIEMPRPDSSAGSARRRRGRWSSPSVTSMIRRRSVRRSRRRIGGVPCWREFATSSLAARTPRSRSSTGKRQEARTPGGEGAGARGRLDAAEEFEGGVVEELGVRARCGRGAGGRGRRRRRRVRR